MSKSAIVAMVLVAVWLLLAWLTSGISPPSTGLVEWTSLMSTVLVTAVTAAALWAAPKHLAKLLEHILPGQRDTIGAQKHPADLATLKAAGDPSATNQSTVPITPVEAPLPNQTANDIRLLAEELDGTRDRELYVVVKEGRLVQVKDRPTSGEFATIRTDWHGRGLRREPGTTVGVSTGGVTETADAVFISQSAFEKFVIPYYVRSKSLKQLSTDLVRFYENDYVCVFHEPGSIIEGTRKKEGIYGITRNGSLDFIGP